MYGDPVAVQKEAVNHWEYALLSQAAYLKAEEIAAAQGNTGKDAVDSRIATTAGKTESCPEPAAALLEAKWTYWKDFPDSHLRDEFKKVNLRVEVWERKTPPAVVVTFGGTVFESLNDWKSNLRWFLPIRDDEYTQLVKEFVPAFTTEYRRHVFIGNSKTPPIYSTGHSLGGGLAQQFAYALPVKPDGLIVDRVIVFDPSPVTGYYSVEEGVRTRGAKRLVIDRVFERGEVLASVRSILAFFYRPSEESPAVRAVRYNFEGIVNPITAHSMSRLACGLFETAKGQLGHRVESDDTTAGK
ncbi:hypothetical protein [Caballeronia humi]|uniref:hypothetical protein n=1 Tax=Caballeronia humi TaxID=326474 RepID=UPI001F16820C|nr:hypothetical protein [Caballeronia humi]